MKADFLKKTVGSKNKILVPLLTGITLLFFVAFLLLPLWPALMIKGGQKTLLLPMKKGEEFSILYTHSANKSPVKDTIEWADKDLLIIKQSLFLSYGAGIPDDGDIKGAFTIVTPDGIIYANINAPQKTITLITGTIADHHILYKNESIQLKKHFGEGQKIKLSAIKASTIKRLLLFQKTL